MSVVFFTDRDLGLTFPAILRTAGLAVERHADHFAPATPDEEWLRVIAGQGWVAGTHDARIRYKRNELAAVLTHKVSLLVIVGHALLGDLARSFAGTSERIFTFLSRNPPPVIGKVYRPSPAELSSDPNARGRVERWYP